MMGKGDFNPLQSQPGEFRVALHLSELGERAWEVLELSQQLGFEKPKFKTYVRQTGAVEVWAIVLQQFHRFDADPELVVDPWDQRLEQLWQACEPDAELKLVITTNLEAFRSDYAAIA
jgi:hypothetical protein